MSLLIYFLKECTVQTVLEINKQCSNLDTAPMSLDLDVFNKTTLQELYNHSIFKLNEA